MVISTYMYTHQSVTTNSVLFINSGPAEEEKCISDETKGDLMEEAITGTSDDIESCPAEVSKELEDESGSASKPKDSAVVSSGGDNSKASKKVL